MHAELPILDKRGGLPLAEQIAAHFAAAIREGQLRVGDRLPTIRAIAKAVGVTPATVQDAYRRLAQRGLVRATVGRGTEVCETHGGEAAPQQLFAPQALAVLHHLERENASPPLPEGVALVADMAGLLPDHALFPVEEFLAAFQRVLRSSGASLLGYGEPMGHPRLLQLLTERCAREDDGGSDDAILITSGAQQGIDLVLRSFTRPGDAVAVAVPTYHHVFGLLAANGLQALPVPCGDAGLESEALRAALGRARLLYVMPTFGNPTGRTLDRAARAQLIEAVRGTQVPILEDEFQRDLRFRGAPQPTLRSLDPRRLTLTLRTFSKGLFPGVRVGWLQAPSPLLAPLAALKRYSDLETSPLLQAALAEFVADGGLDRHLDAVRRHLQRAHRTAAATLRAHAPAGTTWTEPDGGFCLWLEFPAALDADALAGAAAARGVAVTVGRVFDPFDRVRARSAVRLSLSRSTPAQIEAGLQVLCETAGELLAGRARRAARPIFL
ncbi:MAG: PLP-dependent aminotransferase family protein [Planctomycetes bacterium]|nr:PLP-dependent aminotransferase family protein [Planctomycetota bacterium]